MLVKAGSSKEEVVVDGGNITIFVRARAHDGEANTAIIKVLAKHFGVSKSRVEIIRGMKSRHKIVEIIIDESYKNAYR